MQPLHSEEILVLISGLRSTDKASRAQYTREIADYGEDAVPFIVPLLQEPDWIIRYRAAEALGMIEAPDAGTHLIPVCDDQKDHVRYMAAKSLGRLKYHEAVPVLIRLLADPHPYTRGISSESLAAIHDNRAIGPLKDAMEREKDPVIQDRMKKSVIVLEKDKS